MQLKERPENKEQSIDITDIIKVPDCPVAEDPIHQIWGLKKQARLLDAEKRGQESTIARLKKEIDVLKKESDLQAKKVILQNQDKIKLSKEIEKFRKSVQERNNQIAELEQKLHKATYTKEVCETIKGLESQLADFEKIIDEKDLLIMDKRAEIVALNEKVEELKEVAEISRSEFGLAKASNEELLHKIEFLETACKLKDKRITLFGDQMARVIGQLQLMGDEFQKFRQKALEDIPEEYEPPKKAINPEQIKERCFASL